MNPLLIETACQIALGASAFPSTTIYTGTSYAELTPESLNLIVACANMTHEAAGLYTALVTVKVTSPALLGSDSYSQFQTVLGQLKDAMGNDYFLAHWPTTISAPSFVGLWHETTTVSQNEHEWEADMVFTFGLLDS
jgi:hypothetical protein